MKKAVSIVMSAILILLCFASCGSKGMKGTHHAEMVIKNYGTVKIELYGDQAPLTVENFVNLCNKGFYDGLTFHRYVKDFVLQGGDPEGTGLGGCESSVKGEFSANGVKNTIKHKKGVISMARNQFARRTSTVSMLLSEKSPRVWILSISFVQILRKATVSRRISSR